MSEDQNKTAVEKFLKEHEAYLERKNKLLNELSMPIVKAATKIDDKGNAYIDEALFANLLQKIGENAISGWYVTIKTKLV
jgi:hydroxymethylglutaryl-CoA reductase